jgi:hypothetical protein
MIPAIFWADLQCTSILLWHIYYTSLNILPHHISALLIQTHTATPENFGSSQAGPEFKSNVTGIPNIMTRKAWSRKT